MQRIGLKQVLVLAVTAALCVPTSAAAMETDFYGQIDQLVMYASDGNESSVMIGDNDNSSSRVGVKIKEKLDSITIGGVMEIEGQLNASNKMTIPQNDDGDFEWNVRKMEGYFQGGYGKVSLGQGDGAANGTAEVDLSGTKLITYSQINATAGSMSWVDSAGNPIAEVNETRDVYDGLSRNERVRYDTPSWAGFSFAASMTNGAAYELAARYSGNLYGKLEAAIGYVDTNDREKNGTKLDFTQWDTSASWLLKNGLNFTATVSQRNNGDNGKPPESLNYYGKIGYKWGIQALSVEYGATLDKDQEGDTSSNFGIGYVIKPWKKVELYAAARQHSLDREGISSPDPIVQVMAGTRIKF